MACDRRMAIELGRPGIDGLAGVVAAMREWQREEAAIQLHPGDVGWFWRSGAPATAAALRTWSRDGRLLAVGLLDGSTVLRLEMAPAAESDDELARCLAEDVADPDRGVLPAGSVAVEAPPGAVVRDRLHEARWRPGEAWTPLQRSLTEPVPQPDLRIEAIGASRAAVRCAVHQAAFEQSTLTEERWQAMAAGPAYADARCLVAFDESDAPVAAATVWSAGAGRPGLLEPVGVHRDHRGRGFGRAITLAAAAALRRLGASSAVVITPSANAGAIATYAAAGFVRHPERLDLTRP